MIESKENDIKIFRRRCDHTQFCMVTDQDEDTIDRLVRKQFNLKHGSFTINTYLTYERIQKYQKNWNNTGFTGLEIFRDESAMKETNFFEMIEDLIADMDIKLDEMEKNVKDSVN